ncbi:MHCK/EF2 kinase [Gracilaria domingensis]|nr:MHCK/EF2 kinase [Gracilaria domingensis]
MFERLDSGRLKRLMPVVVKLQMATGNYLSRSLSDRTRLCELEADNTVRKHEMTSNLLKKWCTLTNKHVDVLPAAKMIVSRECTVDQISQERFPVLHHLFKKLSLDAVLYNGAIGTVEEYLEGRFTKFLNNDGDHNSLVRANFPGAFAHWTWVDSGGSIMVSDIQGVRTGDGYVLTDPCVHSVSGTGFGATDLGLMGVEEFFVKHRCNGLCNDLKLARDGSDLDAGNLMRTRILKMAGSKEESEDPSVKTRITHEDEDPKKRSDRRKGRSGAKEGTGAKLRARANSSRVRRSSVPCDDRRRTKRFTRPTSFKDLRVDQLPSATAEQTHKANRSHTFGGLLALVLGRPRRHGVASRHHKT